jgi:pilus assembly protein CpaE
MQFPGIFKSLAASAPEQPSPKAVRVGYVEGVISSGEIAAMASQFPKVSFESIGSEFPRRPPPNLAILIVGVNAASVLEMESAVTLLRTYPAKLGVLVALRNADVAGSRVLTRSGAADVIPIPSSEAAWALSLERLLTRDTFDRDPGKKPGQVVALLKAGGGVGATSLGVQAAFSLAARGGESANICFADLDLQFGAAALHFDLAEALTITDCVAVGEVLEDTQFATALAAHKTGIRVLAAPRDIAALDALTPKLVESLIGGLRRDFPLTILDMPSAWTAWTNQALQLADRIILVTRLSVAHVHMVRRQLGVLHLQNLERVPLTLVCNAVTGDQQNFLSVKAAEKAIGRKFDILFPEDTRAMDAAVNQGLPLCDVKRGAKLEKYIEQLAKRIAADAFAGPALQRWP